ncbi:MAG: hypothetical protein E6F94_00240 [Actinobacteria bacterium]|nr:MAG: hypothetical protein E6G38_09260 [Actinomycetota bacterium]TMM28218.1 MAG: hypothetical protein E6F94_00240 [Actinomycetota bacterium]
MSPESPAHAMGTGRGTAAARLGRDRGVVARGVFLSIGLVWFIDLGAAIAAAQRKDQYDQPRKFELPKIKPSRLSM